LLLPLPGAGAGLRFLGWSGRRKSNSAGQRVTIELGDTTLRVIDSNGELITTAPRNGTGEISRFKAYGTRR
jgi:hypothetical protein